MNPSIERAAANLVQQLHAPIGMVNTLVLHQGSEDVIQVWVDQSLYPLEGIPARYEGYRVVSKIRPVIRAHSG